MNISGNGRETDCIRDDPGGAGRGLGVFSRRSGFNRVGCSGCRHVRNGCRTPFVSARTVDPTHSQTVVCSMRRRPGCGPGRRRSGECVQVVFRWVMNQKGTISSTSSRQRQWSCPSVARPSNLMRLTLSTHQREIFDAERHQRCGVAGTQVVNRSPVDRVAAAA